MDVDTKPGKIHRLAEASKMAEMDTDLDVDRDTKIWASRLFKAWKLVVLFHLRVIKG